MNTNTTEPETTDQGKIKTNSWISTLSVIVLIVPLFIAAGFVRSLLWKWFLVPLGAIPINAFQMAGMVVLYKSYFIGTKSNKSNWRLIFDSIAASLITLLVGYAIHKLSQK